MSIILPAVLSDQLEDYENALDTFGSFPGNDKVHIDIMDGDFVDSMSADLEEILELPTMLERQVHLMVQDPKEDLELCKKHGVEEVIFHYQSDFEEYEKLDEYKSEGMEIYLGINPEIDTIDIINLEGILKYFDGVLVMTVVPGKQGGEFLSSEIMEVINLRHKGFEGKIIEDGHVNIDTIDQVKNFDIDEFVVGSGIIKQPVPLSAYVALKSKLPNVY